VAQCSLANEGSCRGYRILAVMARVLLLLLPALALVLLLVVLAAAD
jgi:hypothetical protein